MVEKVSLGGRFYFCGHLSQEGEVERCMDARKATHENETGCTSGDWQLAAGKIETLKKSRLRFASSAPTLLG
ncbi:hypothetical protein KO489_14545 [Reinekea forsetii]|nr:hypothetical protein [Reinekea forsetii]